MNRRFASTMAAVLLITACSGDDGASTTTIASTTSSTAAPTTSSSTSTTSTTPATTSTTTSTTTTVPQPTVAAPWSGDVVPEGPQILETEWSAAENNEQCSALFPTEPPTVDGQEPELRRANFAGGWGIAWDRDDGPGREPTGAYCEDCGRGAFGIAGTGSLAASAELDGKWPTEIAYSDGSLLGYGPEGFADDDPLAPLLAEIRIGSEGCLYQVWSFLGDDHLLGLIDQLRFVDGLRSPTFGEERRVTAMGEPSWVAFEPLPRDEVDPIYFTEWAEAGEPEACPLLVFGDLGDAADGRIRQATNFGEMLVAFDRPSGPGHDGSSEPCDDCGRGAIGIGTFQNDVAPDRPLAYEWDDSSTGYAEPRLYGIEALVFPDGFDCAYWVWSHLGWDHLDVLLAGLRTVEGSP